MMRTIAASALVTLVLGACAGDGRATGREGTGGQRPAAATSAGLTPSPSPTASPTPTPTTQPEPFRFAVIGDFGTGLAAEEGVAARMCRYRRRHPFDLVVTTGDNIYPDGATSDFDSNFFGPMACLLNRGVRFHATLGNHDTYGDGGISERREPAFGFRRGRANYVFRRSGVRFVMADSNSLDRTWLRRALVAETGDRFTIVAFHHPVYSPGTGHGSTPGFAPSLPRMFRRRGVDLVLNGHDHIYSVTRSLRGIRYVVTGGGGATEYGCGSLAVVERCEVRFHFLAIKVTDSRLEVTAVPRRGAPFDRFSTSGRD